MAEEDSTGESINPVISEGVIRGGQQKIIELPGKYDEVVGNSKKAVKEDLPQFIGDNQGNDNLSINEVEILVEGLDRVDIIQKKKDKGGEQFDEESNLVDILILKNNKFPFTTNKPVTWKRARKNKIRDSYKEGVGSNAKFKKIPFFDDDETQEGKKQREIQLDSRIIEKSSETEVGGNQPRQAL